MNAPPKWMTFLLKKISKPELFEDLDGDLFQLYQRDLKTKSPFAARLRYFINVLQYLQPFSMKKPQSNGLTFNYLKVIRRGLWRQKFFTTVNLVGLSLAFLSIINISIYAWNELNFDKHHEKHERVFRITYRFQNDSGYDIHWARVNQPWINEIPENFPEIEKLVRFQSFRPRDVKVGEEKFRENHAYSVDPSVFQIFSFDWIQGNESALDQPFSVVLTASSAKKYFGDITEAINSEIELRHEPTGLMQTHIVRGVVADLPAQSHLPITLLSTINSVEDRAGWAYTYFLLKESQDLDAIESRLPEFIESREDDPEGLSVHFQPLTSIHLHSDLSREIVANGDWSQVMLFLVIGTLILIIASINFSNLQTIKSLGMSKSVGVRKVLGSGNFGISSYFFMESFVISLVSLFIGLGLFLLIQPSLENFIGYPLDVPIWLLVGGLTLILALHTLLASIYPSGVLNAVGTIDALRGNLKTSFGGRTFQKVLVTLQFLITLSILSGTLIIHHQFNFLTDQKLGFDHEQLIAIKSLPLAVREKYETFKTQLSGITGIESVTAVLEVPTVAIKDEGVVQVQGQPETFTTDIQVIDINAPEVLGMEYVAGKGLPESIKTRDSEFQEGDDYLEFLRSQRRAYLVNESAMRLFGWQDASEAIGKQISWSIGAVELASGSIMGVLKDYHQESLKVAVDPQVFTYEPIWLNNIIIRTEAKSTFELVSRIEERWDENFPDIPLEISFLETEVQNLYQREQKQKALMSVFSGIGFVITILGLISLVGFTTEKRMKEFAIRKVLGARLTEFLKLLGKDLFIMIVISLVVGVPVVWKLAGDWLNDYAYHIDLGPVYFMITASLIILVVGVILLTQILKVSQKNPSDVLRSE